MALDGVPLMGLAARAGMHGESREVGIQELSVGGLDATVCRVRTLRTAVGPVAIR